MMLPFAAAPIIALAAQTLSLGASTYAVAGPMRAPGAAPAWRDEFNGARVDASKWRFDTSRNKEGWFNGEQQYYAADRRRNVRVSNGKMRIIARRENLDASRFPDWGGQHYTSTKIISNAAWTYGFYEIRAKLPCARGTWPAIWMLPANLTSWPEDGEIDIMEQVGSEPNLIYATLHTGLFNHSKKTQRGATRPLPTSCTSFHRYQLDWKPDSITIGIDDRAMMRVANDQPGGKGAWPFDAPFQLIINLAIGGDWAAAKGIDDQAMPQRLEVDYVRVW